MNLQRFRSDRVEALAASTWEGHVMPYGPTKMVNGQNQGARALAMQVLGDEIEVVWPEKYRTKTAIFPRPA